MDLLYRCPYCKGAINANEYIILSSKTKDKKVGLILLHEEIGNYSALHTPTLEVEPGEIVDIYCPICHKNLKTRRGEHFATFNRRDEEGNESRIIISRKYREEVTFKIEKGKETESYGESARKYMDPEWYL
jgi:hypothetical protein